MKHKSRELILAGANVIAPGLLGRKARWVAVREGVIAGVGEGDYGAVCGRSARVIDCRGKTVLPGFIDPHFHLLSYIEAMGAIDLRPGGGLGSIPDIQSRLRKFAQHLDQGAWIKGRGYDEFHLAEKRHPDRRDLDEAVSDRPVKLTHRSGHAHVLNSLGLRLAGISITTPDPPGGMIDRYPETGEPSGLLYEMGEYLAVRIALPSPIEVERGLSKASRELVSLGITSLLDVSSKNDHARRVLLRSWKESGRFAPRLRMMLGMKSLDELGPHSFSEDTDNDRFKTTGVKIILDETTGRFHPSEAVLRESVLKAQRHGLQAAIHAIEQNAVEAACESIEYALKEFPGKDNRHRIEHCSLCSPSLAKRIASLGIVVVSQPAFVFFNGERYVKTVPKGQLRFLYPLRTLLDAGVVVAASSDCPIVPPNPLVGIASAVSREAASGDIVVPQERITAMDAVKLYTQNAAYATFDEKMLGDLSAGKLADLVILNGDPTRIPPDEIRDLEVEMTIIGGEIVWERSY